METEKTQRQPDYEKAGAMALRLLEKYKITEPPVVAVTLANDEGLKVFGVELSKDFGEGIAGFINPREKTMYIKKDDPPKRQNFTIAHELGHWMLGHVTEGNNAEYSELVFRQTNEERRYSPIEQEANHFAATLLMPVKFFIRLAARYPELSIADMHDLFGVSEEAFWHRIHFLGLQHD